MLQKMFNLKFLHFKEFKVKKLLKNYVTSMAKKVGNLLHNSCNGDFISLKDKLELLRVRNNNYRLLII